MISLKFTSKDNTDDSQTHGMAENKAMFYSDAFVELGLEKCNSRG